MQSAKKFFRLGIVVAINLALQFVFQWFVIISFGAGTETDIFFGSMALPNFILLVLSGSLTIVLIPIMSKFRGDDFQSESWNYFQGIGLLFTAIGILLLLTAQWWVQWVLPGFKDEGYQLAVNLSRIQVVSMVLSALLSVLWAIHSAKENFYLIELTSIIASIISLAVLYFTIGSLGIYSPAWAGVLKTILQILLLAKVLGPYQQLHSATPSFKEAWKKLKPLVAGNLYYKLDAIVDRNLTSTGTSGQLTLFNLAQMIYTVGSTIVSKVFGNTMIPDLARLHHDKREKDFKTFFNKRMIVTGIIAAGTFIGVIVLGDLLLTLAFKYKNFDHASIGQLHWIMICLGGYWIAGTMGNITAGYFYSRGDTRTPTIIGAVLFTLYMPLKIFAYTKFKITGLALSVSIYMMIVLLAHFYFIYRKKSAHEQDQPMVS